MRMTIVLQKGQQSAIEFEDPASGRRLTLLYNRLFTKLPTVNQQPDNVIQLASDEDLYLFDAKYRLEYTADYRRLYNGVGPTVSDINTMHRYRDAIVIPRPAGGGFKRGVVRGAIVLFPWRDEQEYTAHTFYKSIEDVEIGGFPFLPGATSLATQKIAELLASRGFLISVLQQ